MKMENYDKTSLLTDEEMRVVSGRESELKK